MVKQLPEEVRKIVMEEVRKGNLVVIHPAAKGRFRGARVKAVDYPK